MKVKSFIREFSALVAGETTKVQAEKTLRSADNALKAQIANLEGDKISLEDAVEEAADQLRKARYNFGKEIKDRTDYVSNLVNCKNAHTEAVEALDEHNALISFLKEELKEINHEEAELASK